MKHHCYKKQGFTLAEVLITLGIIGVVAALTYPVVISKIDEREMIVHWKKMYSVISQAFNETLAEGISPCKDGIITGGTLIDMCRNNAMATDFMDAFSKKLNAKIVFDSVNKRCGVKESKLYYCGGGGAIHTLKDNGSIGAYNYGLRTLELNTGEQVLLGEWHGGPFITVDLDGYNNGKNTLGKDVFVMKVYYNTLRAMGAEGTFNKTYNGNVCMCGKDYGLASGPYYAGAQGVQEVASGVCCSAYYLSK